MQTIKAIHLLARIFSVIDPSKRRLRKTLFTLSLVLLAASHQALATVTGPGKPGPSATPIELSGVYTPTLAESDVYVFYSYELNGGFVDQLSLLAASVAPVPTPFSLVFEKDPGTVTNEQVAVFGVYDTINNYVTISLSTTQAPFALGETFSTFFGGASETALASDLESTSDPYPALNFFGAYEVDFPTLTADVANSTLVNFSGGTPGGGFNVTETPEPSAWALLVFGGTGLLGLTLRRAQRA